MDKDAGDKGKYEAYSFKFSFPKTVVDLDPMGLRAIREFVLDVVPKWSSERPATSERYRSGFQQFIDHTDLEDLQGLPNW